MGCRSRTLAHGILGLWCTLVLAACNGAQDTHADPAPPLARAPDPAPPPPAPTPESSSAPEISGSPSVRAVAGQPYSFQPTATDSDGDHLNFAVSGMPAWASFDPTTGRLWGTPARRDVGSHWRTVISVSDSAHTQALPEFELTVVLPRKSNYGHYFATHYSDTPADAAMLCEQPGVTGTVWRQTWSQVETAPGVYNFDSFDKVLAAIAASRNPHCQLWLMVEFKSFANSPVKNPCPVYLQAQHSAPNSNGRGAATCFMWEPTVARAYEAMMKAAAAHFDDNPRVEGFILQESSLSLNGDYSQDVGDGGTYTPAGWRDALIELIDQCAAAFASSRCAPFLNFLRGGQSYLHDISAAISAVPDNRVCISGPDLLPNDPSLYENANSVYQVITRHNGCRSNSAQNNSYQVPGCDLECIFHFAVSGSFGAFPANAPLSGGLCVNSYIFWNDRTDRSATGQDWKDALVVIARHPYGPDWLDQCAGSEGSP
jgi:hypothetical protein